MPPPGWIPEPESALGVGRLDPYSHWLLLTGREFDLSAEGPRSHPADFTFLGYVDQQNVGTYVKNPPILRIEQVAGLHDKPDVAAIGDKLSAVGELQEPLLYALPLRRRSLPSDSEGNPRLDAGFGFSEWTPPAMRDDGIAAEPLDPERVVVVACIDDAINIAHPRFRLGRFGSRVDYAWVQDGDAGGDVPFGHEWTRQRIEAALGQHGTDESAILDALGLIDFARPGTNTLARRVTHGTHVLDIAAGGDPGWRGPADPDLINRRIISVALPNLVTRETSGAHLTQFFVSALQYVLLRTKAMGEALDRPLPLVVNFSYGIAGGPHDGSHYIERVIDELVAHHQSEGHVGKAAVCLPAGNANLSRGHVTSAEGSATRHGRLGFACRTDVDQPAERTPEQTSRQRVSLTLPLRVQPGDRSSSYLEVWLPHDAASLSVRVVPPGSPGAADWTVPDLAAAPAFLLHDLRKEDQSDSAVIARLSLDQPGLRIGTEAAAPLQNPPLRVVLAIAPTDIAKLDRSPAPAGLWQVEVSAEIGPDECIDAWVQRDDTPLGFPRFGRQAYFDDPTYRRFDERGDVLDTDPATPGSVVRRSGTLNGIATAEQAVVVAAWQIRDERLSAYSATAASVTAAPEAAAPADRSRALPGVLAAGTGGGSRVAVSGTSVACPALARLLAKEWAHHPDRPAAEIVAGHTVGGAGGSPTTVAPTPRIGAGVLTPAEQSQEMT